jgi:hypothetical protein
MKAKKTYKELKEEYKKEFKKVIIEMEEFRDDTEIDSNIKEFEVPLPPKYLIDKRLKTKTYLVYSLGYRISGECNGPQIFARPRCLKFDEGDVKKKNIKIESLFRYLSRYIPERLLNKIFYICIANNDRVLNTISERRHIMKEERTFKEL